MDEKLRENAHKGGRADWRGDAPHLLLMRVIEEVADLLRELRPERKARDAFMIAAHLRELVPCPPALDAARASWWMPDDG